MRGGVRALGTGQRGGTADTSGPGAATWLAQAVPQVVAEVVQVETDPLAAAVAPVAGTGEAEPSDARGLPDGWAPHASQGAQRIGAERVEASPRGRRGI